MYKSRKAKRLYRKRSFRRGNKKTYIIAKKAARSVIRQQLETKYFDFDTTASISYSGAIYQLTGMTQGSTDLERVGDKVSIKSLQIRGAVEIGDTTNIMRVIVFQFLSDSATTPAFADVLQNFYLANTNAPLAPYAKDFAGYTTAILWDKTFNLHANQPQLLFDCMLTSKDFVKKARKNIQYQGGGQNGVGNLYLLAVSDSAAISHPGITFVSRFRYLDN